MSRLIRPLALAALALLLAHPAARAQAQSKAAPEERTGPKVGEKAPSFVLKDADGKDRSLDEFLGKGRVALVFTRSADW